jgi:hypothetical protein
MHPNTALAARLQEAGIDHIDLCARFAEEGATKALYKPRDTHWNIAGNALAAQMLAGRLTELLPATPTGSATAAE